MGKQSSFTRQNAYDVLCTISSASHRNSTLEVDLRRTRKNVSVLASRLQEAQFIIGILEEALFSLLPPVPILPAPPLPPRPDVVMDPPASEEDPEPLSLADPASSPPDPNHTPESTETLPPANRAPPALTLLEPLPASDPLPEPLPSSPRPPKARTPPALPSPDRTSFPLSEWNYPRRTYRSLEDIPLVPAPTSSFCSPLAAPQPPLTTHAPCPLPLPPPLPLLLRHRPPPKTPPALTLALLPLPSPGASPKRTFGPITRANSLRFWHLFLSRRFPPQLRPRRRLPLLPQTLLRFRPPPTTP